MKKITDIVYSEKYKPPSKIKKNYLPVLNHLTEGFKIETAYLLEAGRYSDGKEYQIIKVVISEEAL